MATHSGILACGIPWTEEPGRLYSPWDCKRVRHDLVTKQQQPLILEYFNWQHTEDVKKKKKNTKTAKLMIGFSLIYILDKDIFWIIRIK